MFLNNIHLALRNIFNNKVYSIINVLGLALGVSACLIAYLIIRYDLSFDTFHPDKDRIYRVISQWSESDGRITTHAILPPTVPELIRQELSGVEKVCGLFPFSAGITVPDSGHPETEFTSRTEGDQSSTVITEPDYFDIFQYTWLAGTPSAFDAPFKS